MKRRKFLSSAAIGGAAASLGAVAPPGLRANREISPRAQADPIDMVRPPNAGAEGASGQLSFSVDPNRSLAHIGRWSLEELRDYFRKDLFENRVPLWEKYAIDRESGAYLPNFKKNGTYTSTDKRLYTQGRILWLFSYLFNHFGRKRRHLDAALQGLEALAKHGRDAKGRWGTAYTRDWKVKTPFQDIFAEVYMLLGLGEYYKASGDEDSLRLARETARNITETVLAPHFRPSGHAPAYEPGTKRMGTWLHFLSALTPLLEYAPDEVIDKTAQMCVRFILQFHRQKERGYALEYLRQDFSPFPDDALNIGYRYVSGWQSIQGAWIVMAEALRSRNKKVFLEAMDFGLRTLELCWEDIPEFGLVDFENIDSRKKARGNGIKPVGALPEIFIFTLLAVEHTHSAEAAQWFEKVFSHVWDKPGIWDPTNDFHEPRGSMFCLLALERMISRKGRISHFFLT
jgi:mannose/cellobiose epimerase-like protein (N-acyl-D-glucosamine 2-epimerase family)